VVAAVLVEVEAEAVAEVEVEAEAEVEAAGVRRPSESSRGPDRPQWSR
jgi:hypothetical protein